MCHFLIARCPYLILGACFYKFWIWTNHWFTVHSPASLYIHNFWHGKYNLKYWPTDPFGGSTGGSHTLCSWIVIILNTVWHVKDYKILMLTAFFFSTSRWYTIMDTQDLGLLCFGVVQRMFESWWKTSWGHSAESCPNFDCKDGHITRSLRGIVNSIAIENGRVF